jgi:membrane protein required for colicin V production
MTGLDYAALGVAGLSAVLGMWRGLAREVMSLGAWLIAFLAANLLAGPLGEALPQSIRSPELRVLIAFVALFLVVLVLVTLAGFLMSKMIRAMGLGGLDRTLGALFGLTRALVIALAFALIAGLTRIPLDPMWRESVSGPLLARGATALKPWLPPALASRLRYH